jgi:serine/threonine-protein kinase RsbW
MEAASSFDNLESLVEEAQGFVHAHINDEDFNYQVVLLVSEAVTNAMEHGNHFDDGKNIRVEVLILSDRVVVCVQDEGEGFDPEEVDNPLEEANLLRESGRGLFLIKRMADVVTYDRDRRELCLELFRPDG